MPQANLAIIGAGPAGLVAARWALANGLHPVIFEQRAELGGLWNPKTGGMWNSMRTNISKFTCSYSDLPWADDAPMFPSGTEMYEYFCRYAKMFDLEKYINFNTEVKLVDYCDHYWQIVVQSGDTVPVILDFDFVIVATGSFAQPDIPRIHGLKGFMNEPGKMVLHSHGYKHVDPLTMQDKRVLVVGNGFSATEIAAELANFTVVRHVFNKPHWVLPRYIPMPLDLGLISNQRHARKTADEVRVKTPEQNQRANTYLADLCREQSRRTHPLYIDPNSPEPPFVSISDDYIREVNAGNIHLRRGEIDYFTRNGYVMRGNDHVHTADVVIFGTGFRAPLQFLTERVRKVMHHDPRDKLQNSLLFAGALHPTLPNFACVGTDRGPYQAKTEMVARYVTALFANKLQPPATAAMQTWIKQEKATRLARPRVQFPHSDYVGFTTTLAREMDCDPMQGDFATTDPVLHKQLLHTTVTAADFRLRGPNANPLLYQRQATQIRRAIDNSSVTSKRSLATAITKLIPRM